MMRKPIRKITITTLDEKSTQVDAVFDSGAYWTIIREDRLPEGAAVLRRSPKSFRTAAPGANVEVTGGVVLTMQIGEKMIEDSVLVSPNLFSDMLLGAKTMQAWDISILNKNGETEIRIGHDMRDPEITEVD